MTDFERAIARRRAQAQAWNKWLGAAAVEADEKEMRELDKQVKAQSRKGAR